MNQNSGDAGTPSQPAEQKPIGEARMLSDGELLLQLYAIDPETGAKGHTQLRFSPPHPQYDDIVEHLGGLRPGEQKLVPPWKEKKGE